MTLVFSVVARDAIPTKARLVRAAECRFARDGIAGARLATIVREAGQANDSAVGYHFGSRQGLVQAIAEEHLAAMEERRAEPDAGDDVAGLVRKVVEPTADLLTDERGRDFLRIMEQLAGFSGIATGRTVELLTGTILERQLQALVDALRPRHGATVARERVAMVATFLAGALAERAREAEAQRRFRLSHQRFVDELVAMLAGALTA